MAELNETVARWFKDQRGIAPETVEAFGIYTEGRDIVIPYPEGMTKRRYSTEDSNPFGLAEAGRRFTWRDADGNTGLAGQVPFLPPGFEPRERMIIAEGETDTMAVWQALQKVDLLDKVGVVGLSGVGSFKAAILGIDKNGVQARPSRLDELFGIAKRVFVPLDNDDPYAKPNAVASVERGWKDIQDALGRKARRVRLPQGANDLAEFFMAYDWPAFEVLLKAAAERKRNYPRLDWSKPVPPTDWLVKGVFEMGAVTTIAGEPGLGKSFLTMALALAVANGETRYLGQELLHQGVVLYIDEENNEGLIRQRFKALGLTEATWEQIEYLSFPGVNLFKNPAPLLEDALDTEPTLVVFDSQKAVSPGAKENDNDDMGHLYQFGFKPLARQTGAAVVVIHHAGRERHGARGASMIDGGTDQLLTVVKAEAGHVVNDRMNIFPQKERRLGVTLQAEIVGDMEVDGWVRVQAPNDMDAM